jgi:hypothetical protein
MSKNDRNITRILEKICLLAAFLLITVLIITAAASLVQRKDSVKKYSDFLDNADKIDVLFFGSSHMLNAVSPAQLYRQTGITSYNMAKPGGVIPEAYWTYELARQYCNPKCIVIDLWSLDRDYHYIDVMNGPDDKDMADNAVSLLHTNLDVWPLNRKKIEAVNDLISSPKRRMEFLFDFSLYHGRWSELAKDDFDQGQFKGTDYLLGAETNRYMIRNYNIFEPDDKSGTLEEETESIKYLKKLIEECKQDDIDVVLTFMPMGGSYYQDFQAANYGKELAEEYDLEFVDMLDHESDVVNINFDMSDPSHVNEFGMSKITRHLGKILKENERLSDHRGQEGYELYNDAVKFLNKTRLEKFKDEKDLYMSLGYLNMLNCDFAILFRAGSAALEDNLIIDELEQLSGTRKAYEAGSIDGPYFLYKQHLPDEDEVSIFERAGESQDSDIRTVRGSGEYIGFNNFNAFYYNGNYDDNLFDMEGRYYCDAQLFVFDDEGEIITEKYFGRDFSEVEE